MPNITIYIKKEVADGIKKHEIKKSEIAQRAYEREIKRLEKGSSAHADKE